MNFGIEIPIMVGFVGLKGLLNFLHHTEEGLADFLTGPKTFLAN